MTRQITQHRLAAGVIVEDNDRILLVRHRKPGIYDFWVAPGGGVEGVEDLASAARREVLEESGVEVELGRIAYIEEFFLGRTRECKIWFLGRATGGVLNATSPEAQREHIVEAAWFSRAELAERTVYPPVLNSTYWEDRRGGVSLPRYFPPRPIEYADLE